MKRYVFYLIMIASLEIGLSLYLTSWRESFWDSIVAKQGDIFLQQLGVFTVVALALCFLSGYGGYLVNLTVIEWRKKLNTKALTLKETKIENVGQRVQQDALDYPDLMLNLGWELVKSIMYILVFSGAMLYSFPWYYLAILVVYGVIGTYLTKKIAFPLISLNYQVQKKEATYRTTLTKDSFDQCVALMWSTAIRQKYLSYFQTFYGQLGVIVPYLLIAPLYFMGGMKVGELMRFASTAGTVLDNLSFGVNSFGKINKLLSCRKRLKELGCI